MIPDTPIRAVVPNYLCQRCYCPLDMLILEDFGSNEESDRVSLLTQSSMQGVGELGPNGNGKKDGDLRAAKLAAFGELEDCANTRKNFLVDDVGLLRSTKRAELPIMAPKAIFKNFSSFFHGSSLTGHYKILVLFLC